MLVLDGILSCAMGSGVVTDGSSEVVSIEGLDPAYGELELESLTCDIPFNACSLVLD